MVLAALADAPYYFLTASGFAWEQIVTFITAAFACYLLVGDADEIGSKGRNLSISRRRNKRPAFFATLAPDASGVLAAAKARGPVSAESCPSLTRFRPPTCSSKHPFR